MPAAEVIPAMEEVNVSEGLNGPGRAGEAEMYARARREKCTAEMRLVVRALVRGGFS